MHNGERTVSSTNGAGKTCKRKKLDLYLIPQTKTNSKWIKDLNIRFKTVKTLEENTGEKLHDIGLDNDFMDMTPKAQVIKTKINK